MANHLSVAISRWGQFVAFAVVVCCMLLITGSVSGQEVCPYRFSSADQRMFNSGLEAYNAKHYAEATTLLRKVSAKNPKAAEPYFLLGMMAARQNTNPAAIRRYFTQLAKVCPDHPNALAHYYLGIINYTDEKYEAAVADFNRYFEISNQNSLPEYVAVYEEASNYLYWSQFLAEALANRVPFNPQVVQGVSSLTDEILPYLSWDGRTMYYLRQVSQRKEATYYGKMYDKLEPRLCMSVLRDTTFSPGEELPPPFNQGLSEGGVTLTADNQLLYYSVMTTQKGISNFDICFSERKDGEWQPVQNAGSNVNTPQSWDSQPSISADGQKLYFASNRTGGLGGTDIWYCHRLPNGDWSRAENLGPSVNTSGNEKCPFLHADGKTLYFASDGWQGFGGYDMYFIDLRNVHSQRPTNMGMPINGDGDDICFGITTDGRQGYFAGKSKDYNGVGGRDVFWFDLYPDARPESMRALPVVVDKPQGSRATLTVQRYGAPDAVYHMSTDSISAVFSTNETNVLCVVAEGCLPVVRLVTKPEVQHSLRVFFKLEPLRKQAEVALPDKIFSERGLTEPGKKALDCYVNFLLEHPRLRIRIECTSAAQCQAVNSYLATQKLRADRWDCVTLTAIAAPRLVVSQSE